MIKSYILVTLRNLYKQKVYTFINVSGLAIGLASFVLILLYVQSELSYDSHWAKKDRIFRVTSKIKLTDQDDYMCMSSFMLSPTLKSDYPEVEEAIRLMPIGKQTIWKEDNEVFELEDVNFTENEFFKIFDYEFIDGSPADALLNPGSIVLTEKTALKLFGTTQNVVGRTLRFSLKTYKITAIIKQDEDNSHLYFTALMTLSSINPLMEQQLKSDWFYMAQTNYVLLKKPSDADNFDKNFTNLIDKRIKPWLEQEGVGQSSIKFQLQPVTEIHLNNELKTEFAKVTSKNYIYIFSFVAFLLLIIASINYMNLATARSANRAKEVGIRKTAGATKGQLVTQFIGESVITTFIAILLALSMVEMFLPGFNALSGKSLSLGLSGIISVLPLLVGTIVLVGILSGSYPALYLSKFNPVEVLKSNYLPNAGGVNLRKILVVVQFSISVGMIFCTLMVFRQMNYLKNSDLGFNNKQMLVLKVPVADSLVNKNFQTIKNEFLQIKGVENVTNCNQIPGYVTGKLFHLVQIENKTEERLLSYMMVDYQFVNMMNLKLIDGRDFSDKIISDDTAAFIVNETAVKTFGWKNISDITIQNGLGNNGKIVGVVKDFNYNSLHNPIEPLIMMPGRKVLSNLILKLNNSDMPATIAEIEKKWKLFSQKYPTEYYFLDDKFNEQYLAEEKLLKIFTYFSVLTICIACLGLFGLASFATEKRTKEIGIRKVMGTPVSRIVYIITSDFIKLVAISFIFAFPAGFYFVNRWLQNFAYKTGFSPDVFIVTSVGTLLIASFTVGYLAYRAANRNPITALRYE